MLIFIPTTPFAAKIIFAANGVPFVHKNRNAVISLTEDDELMDWLKYSGAIRSENMASLRTLTHTVCFDVPRGLMPQIGKDLKAVGLYLDRQYKRELCKITEAKLNGTKERIEAIRAFMRQYDIEDEDYSEDAAVKKVQRFLKQKSTKKASKLAQNSHQSVCNISQVQHYTDLELDLFFHKFKSEYPSYFLTQRGAERKDLALKCQIWIYKHLGNRAVPYIIRKFSITSSSVYRNLQKFESEFRHKHKPTPSFSPLQT